MRISNFTHYRYSRWLLVTAVCVVMTGCASVNLWQDQTVSVSDEEATIATQTANLNLPINRFLSSKRPFSAKQKALLSTLAKQRSNLDSPGLESTLDALIATVFTDQGTPSLVLLAIGDGYQTLEQNELAERYWQRAVNANVDNYFAHDRLAQLFRSKGRFVLARKHYNQAIAAWPEFAIGYRNRGILFDLYMGDKVAALSDYIRYKQLLEKQGESTKLVDRWIKEMQRAVQAES